MSDTYAGRIVDWLDGDTVVLDVTAMIFDTPITIMQHARLFGINAPEVHSANRDEKARGLAAKAFAQSIAPPNSKVTVAASPNGWHDKYGRLLVVLTLPGGKDYAKEAIAAKHALPWDGQGTKPV